MTWKKSLSEENQPRMMKFICRRVKSLLVLEASQVVEVEAYPEMLQQNQGELEKILCGSSEDEEPEPPLPHAKDIEQASTRTNSHRRSSDIRLLPSSANKTGDGNRRASDLLDDVNDDFSHDEKDQDEEDQDDEDQEEIRKSRRRRRPR